MLLLLVVVLLMEIVNHQYQVHPLVSMLSLPLFLARILYVWCIPVKKEREVVYAPYLPVETQQRQVVVGETDTQGHRKPHVTRNSTSPICTAAARTLYCCAPVGVEFRASESPSQGMRSTRSPPFFQFTKSR